MTDKIHCWDGEKFFDCMNGAEEKFTAKVDWDTDILSPGEGCHGDDLITHGDTVKIKFSKFGDGYITATFDWRSDPYYVVAPDGKFFSRFSTPLLVREDISVVQPTLFALTRPSVMPVIEFYAGRHTFADQTFLNCYHDSQNLNSGLTAQQKAVVERFFAAVKAAFPLQFGGQRVATQQKADTPQQTSLPLPHIRYER